MTHTKGYLMNKTTKSASKTAPKSAPIESESTKTFKANLPRFLASVRGNVVADGESFVSKGGVEYDTFRMAYTRIRKDKRETMFIKVMQQSDDANTGVSKGDYVRVVGDYFDELGEYQGNPSVFRTIFIGSDEGELEVLIHAANKA